MAGTIAFPGPLAPPRGQFRPRRYSRLYSRFVRAMRWFMPGLALALLVTVVAWPTIFPSRAPSRPESLTSDDFTSQRMVNPRFRGLDDNGRPFSLAADIATPSTADANVTDLVSPRGDITMENGNWVALNAEQGFYDRQRRVLRLRGQVTLFHDHGYTLSTEEALIDIANNRAEGRVAVSGQGPDSELSGQGFQIEDRGQRILVTGESRLVLYRTQADNPPPPAEDPQ